MPSGRPSVDRESRVVSCWPTNAAQPHMNDEERFLLADLPLSATSRGHGSGCFDPGAERSWGISVPSDRDRGSANAYISRVPGRPVRLQSEEAGSAPVSRLQLA